MVLLPGGNLSGSSGQPVNEHHILGCHIVRTCEY